MNRHVCGLRRRLTSVTIAMGPAFLPYAEPILERCATIVCASLLQYQAYQQIPDMDEPDRLFLVAPDVLSGFTQGMGIAPASHIMRRQPNFLSLLTVWLDTPTPGPSPVRICACRRHSQELALPAQATHAAIMQELIAQVGPGPTVDFSSGCNQAALNCRRGCTVLWSW